MRKKKKTLSGLLIRKYIKVTLLMLAGFLIISLTLGIAESWQAQKLTARLNAASLVKSDYTQTDTQVLEDAGGWLEILDEELKVIYTKGTAAEQVEQYTLNDLFELSSFFHHWDGSISGAVYTSSLVIHSSEKSDYFISAACFTGEDGRPYICVAKLPNSSLRLALSFQKQRLRWDSFRTMSLISIITTLCIGLLLVCVLAYYAKSVRKHLQEPNKKLTAGLRRITEGALDEKLHLNAEYEYQEIEDSFNFMVQDLKESRRKNKEYEQEREQLFGSIAHDIRTPVTSIRGCSQALLEDVVTTEEKKQEYLRTIYTKSERISELMELLMYYTKLNHEEFSLKKEIMNLSEFILEIIAEHYNELEKQQIETELEIPETELSAEIDRVEFGRVIRNLLSNAWKHNPPGTVLKPRLYEQGAHVIFELWDNGSNIPSEIAESLFQPFVLGDESRASKNGNGLGLSICRKIVEKHGGTLIFAEEGSWKYFRISLPAIH